MRLESLLLILLPLCAAAIKSSCSDQFESCKSLAYLCENTGIAGATMRQYCRRTCNTCVADRCQEDNAGCHHDCHWDGKRNYCSCRTGFELGVDGKSCEDVNECENNLTACPGLPRNYCKNTVGSYYCTTCAYNEGYMKYYKQETCCKLQKSTCGYDVTMSAEKISSNSPKFRIVGGIESDEGRWPWMVQLTAVGKDRPQQCGGSLLSNTWVLTAAHCFRDKSRYPVAIWKVTMGTVYNILEDVEWHGDGMQTRKIAELIEHEYFDRRFFLHDIALVRMDKPVQYSDVIRPICLPCTQTPQEGDSCWVVGFGVSDTPGRGSDWLQEVSLPIASMKRCVERYKKNGRIVRPDHMLCAGHDTGNRDACHGDSGGPIMCQRKDSCQWFQAGITSFGLNGGCGEEGVYGVYTSVDAHQDWIRRHIGDEDTSKVCPEACIGLTDESANCGKNSSQCAAFSDYMDTQCKLTCCRQKHDRSATECNDSPLYKATCRKNIQHCRSGRFSRFMEQNCRKTCEKC